MGITMNRFNGSTVRPIDDAIINERTYPQNGILHGCTITHVGGNQISITAGRIMIQGRDCVITAETISAMLPPSTNGVGRLYVRIDLSNTETPVELKTIAVNGDTRPALTQDSDFNVANGIWEEELAIYYATTTVISTLTVTAITINDVFEYNMHNFRIFSSLSQIDYTPSYGAETGPEYFQCEQLLGRMPNNSSLSGYFTMLSGNWWGIFYGYAEIPSYTMFGLLHMQKFNGMGKATFWSDSGRVYERFIGNSVGVNTKEWVEVGDGKVLLWTNPNPTTGIADGATITVNDLSNYDFYEIESSYTTASDIRIFTKTAVGKDLTVEKLGTVLNYRTIANESGDILTVGNCNTFNISSAATGTENTRLIPQRIWGYK